MSLWFLFVSLCQNVNEFWSMKTAIGPPAAAAVQVRCNFTLTRKQFTHTLEQFT